MANMTKILWGVAATLSLHAQAPDPITLLEENCLACHREQKLPDNLIYRRYLLKYSSQKRIEKALTSYLKIPSKEHSIMPREFFLRFPMKYPTTLDEATLQGNIRAYMEQFDVKRRLRLEE
jgi:cytochrome c1